MAGAETTPLSLTPITNDGEFATSEGTVVVQEVISDQGVYISPDLATVVQFQEAIPDDIRGDDTGETNLVPQTGPIAGTPGINVTGPSSNLEMRAGRPEGEIVFMSGLPNAAVNFPVDGHMQVTDGITDCPLEQKSVVSFGQEGVASFPSQLGAEMKDATDQIIPSQQTPVDALLAAGETPQEEPKNEKQTENEMPEDPERQQDIVGITSADITNASQQASAQGQDQNSTAPDLIFVCVHGQTFRCKPQTGIPIETQPKEEPSNTCACSKSKKPVPSNATVAKSGQPTRKLRSRRPGYTCDRCDETFSQRASLEHHKTSHDDDEDEEMEEGEGEEEAEEEMTVLVKTEKNSQKSLSGRVQTRSRQKPEREEKLCPDCGKVFYKDKALEVHKRQHEREKLKNPQPEDGDKSLKKVRNMSCTICPKTFTRMYDVERHMETHVDRDRRKCGACGKLFQTIKSRERHESLHCDSKKQNKCDTCDVVFGSKFKLLRHEREHLTSEQIENLSCKTCLKVFTNANSLLRHEKLHFKEQGAMITCAYCPETFDDRFSYNTHKKSHAVKAYKCDLCDMKFKHEYLMNIHLKRMTCQKKRESLRDVECKLCQKIVKGTATLKRHMRTHTKEKPYPCRIGCGSAFSSTSNRLSHERMYCKMSPSYLCPHCGEVLSNQARLIYHESKYHGIGPVVGGQRTQTTEFPCRFCGKVFFFKGGRKRHERIHTDEKPYMCQFCPKAFVHASALVCHERVHTKARPYVCNECGKAFSQATHLKTHIRVHTKEKPYKCRFCDKAFSHMGTRKSHEATHKNADPGTQAAESMVQRVNEFTLSQQDHSLGPTEIKVVHHEVPIPHKLHVSHHEHEVQAADVILQLLESGSRVSNFEGFVDIAPS